MRPATKPRAKKVIERPKYKTDSKTMSLALKQAYTHVKDFMTDVQKASKLLKEGKGFMETGDIRGAIDCFNEAISFNPSVTLFNIRAACHKMLEMYSEAYFDYCYVIRLEPEVGAHFCYRGLCLARLKKASMALEDLDIAIQLDPNPVHFYSRATTYAEFGNFPMAIEDFTMALKDESHAGSSEIKLKCKYRRALAHFELKEYEAVVKDTTDILMQDPNSVSSRALLGRALKILNDHKKAEEQLTFAILLDDTQAALYTERGDIRFRTCLRNKIIEAIYDFDKAVKLLEVKLASKNAQNDSLLNRRVHRIGSNSSLRSGSSTPVGNNNNSCNPVNILPEIGESPLKEMSGKKLTAVPEEEASEQEDPLPSRPSSATIPAVTLKTMRPSSGRSSQGGLLSSRSGSHSMSLPNIHGGKKNGLNTNREGGSGPSSTFFKEVEEQLADTLFKRAQAKLMIEMETSNIDAALADALKAMSLHGEDDDYHMVAATCFIRLNRYNDAMRVLQHVLDRSPNNYKALYNYSFCQRASGSQKDAIEGLTKIIAYSRPEMQSIATGSLAVPIHRVYEMRGTLFHEMQAHKLALMDLGKAIAINPSKADNYFIRGDCQSKMGNYEQALADYNLAQDKQFEDMCALCIARGSVRRLLGDSKGATADFQNAYTLLDEKDKVGKVRILSFKAFCQIDEMDYFHAHDSLIVAMRFVQEIMMEKLTKYNVNYDDTEKVISKHLRKHRDSWKKRPLNQAEGDILYLKRIEWILDYHSALCLYMQKSWLRAEPVLKHCLSDDARKFVSDDLALGGLFFFMGQTKMRLQKFNEAVFHLSECEKTHWIDNANNKFLLEFAFGKLMQGLGQHEKAIERFCRAMAIHPQNAHCHFRRAWSYKALGNFLSAGDDFETAKLLKPGDPNFAVDYKSIAKCEYMIIESEPDLVEKFKPLLPVPGFGLKV